MICSLVFLFFLALKKIGYNVILGNLTFSRGVNCGIENTKKDLVQYTNYCTEVTADCRRLETGWTPDAEYYWPEFFLSKWFREHEKEEVPVLTFEIVGVQLLLKAYQAVVDKLNIDTIILADGGTDSLMFGDEEGLGTPTEDMTSIASVMEVKNVKTKILINVGFGVDCHHGVAHHQYLENVSVISKEGGFLGSLSLIHTMEECKKLEKAFIASEPTNSIVTSSVVSAFNGEFGNYHSPYTKNRTQGSNLYISPIMSMLWAYDLPTVAKHILYLESLKDTVYATDVRQKIREFRQKYEKYGAYIGKRTPIKIPY